MRKIRLFTPGPTPLLPAGREAMAAAEIHHRSPEFREIFQETRALLGQIFQTRNEVLILTSSGTGAMEAAAANLLGPHDHALAVVAGKFGERWVQICQTWGIPCTALTKDPGQAAQAAELEEAFRREPSLNALLIQACETSTGTRHDLEAVVPRLRALRPDLLILVDGITAVGCQRLCTDEWDLDVVISGSQKAFSLPPGLAFLSLGRRALERLERRTRHPYYLDLKKEWEGQRQGRTAFTPNVSLILALRAACRRILEEGLEEVIGQAEQMARCTRAGLEALGFRLLSASPAPAVTAAFPPPGVPAPELMASLQNRFGVKIAGGQGSLKGQIIRIAHLGYFDLLDVFSILAALEVCLRELGVELKPGEGVSAALSQLSAKHEHV